MPTFLRHFLSTLTDPATRQAAARALVGFCITGYVVTLVGLTTSGAGLQRWFFALLVWGVLVYAPLRILLEALQTLAPAIRRHLIAQTAARDDRYNSRRAIELVVDGLFAEVVVMPRISTPAHHAKVKAGAVALLLRARGDGGAGIERAARRCLAAVERWVGQTASWSAAHAAENIQARWAAVRGLAALAAVTRVLVAAFEDRSGHGFSASPLDGETAVPYLDACLDFCDQLALEVDVVPWTEPSLHLDVAPDFRDRMCEAWKAFTETPDPALTARSTFVDAVLT
jgi:hypothetical protein